MKRYIFSIIAIVLFAFASHAQDKQYTMNVDLPTASVETYLRSSYINFTANDTFNLTDSTYSVVVYPNQKVPVKYDFAITLDSISGTPTVTTILYYKVFGSQNWTSTGDTNTWTGTSSDTTFYFLEHTTAEYARQYRILLEQNTNTGTVQVSDVKGKFWIE